MEQRAKRFLAMILVVFVIIGMLPMSVFAAIEYDSTAIEDDYYKLISKKDWELAPGVQETEIVLNNAEGSKRQVVHTVKVDMNNPYTKVIPGYKGMIPTEGNYGTEATSTQAKNAEALGYGNVVAATNAMLSWYDSAYYKANPHLIGEPLYYNILDGYYYENSQGSATFASKNAVVVINYDNHPLTGEPRPADMPKVMMRSQTDPLTGWEQNAISVWEWLVKPDANGVPKPTYTKNHTSGAESRTFVGITAEGEIVLSVSDGRQAPYSTGFNMYEMGEYMIKMGCIYAANCDGGGSTTFVSERPGEELKVNCSLSDGGERPTTNTFLVISTAPASGEFERATLSTEYDYYTPGSSVTFNALGTDAVGTKVDIPSDVEWTIKEEGMGTIKNGVFTSNGTPGQVTAQILYQGEVVGERTITLAMPDKLSFSQPIVTIPYGTRATIPVKATLDGLYEIGLSPADVTITSSNAELGTVDGLHFIGAATAPAENSSTVTVTLNADTAITASATLKLGEASVVMWDFEDGQADIDEWNSIVLRNPGEAHRDFYHKLSLATKEDGQVHDGDYSMRLETNGLSSADVHSKQYAYVRLGLKDQLISLENARSLGFWLYVPEDNIQCWVQGFYKYDTNGDGTPDTLAEVNLMNSENVYYNVDESGWHYLSMDLSDYEKIDLTYSSPFDSDPSDGATTGDKDEFFLVIIFHKSINNILWATNGSINGPFTYYIDNITVDYSEAVEDREAPIFESVVLESNGLKNNMTKHDVVTTTSNVLNIVANVAEATYRVDGTGTKHTLYNYTGLNIASAKAYIDGVEVDCAYADGKMMISDLAVADGYHRVKFEICDNAGNKATVVRLVNVTSGVKASTIKLVPADPSLVEKDRLDFGSIFWMNMVATNIETIQSVKTVIDLNNVNHWQLDHMVLADGFSATYTIDNETNTATITFTRTGKNYQEGEAVLAQIPIRIIYFDTDMKIPGYTAETVWTTYNFWPHDLKVDVDKGEITYVDGYTSDVLNTFSNEKFRVNTEMYTDFQSMGSDPYFTEHGTTHVHTPVAIADKAATCTQDGYTGRTFCEACNSVVDWGTTIPAKGEHTYDFVNGKLVCTNCDELFNGVYTDGMTYIDGVVVADGWVGESYYLNGVKLVGVHIIDGKYYEFDENGICAGKIPKSLWYTNEKGESFYLDAGVPMTQYTMINTVPTYFGDDGVAYQGEIEINGEICVFEMGAFVKCTTADVLLAGRIGPDAAFILYADGTFVLCGEGETWNFVSVGKTYLPNLSWKNRPWGKNTTYSYAIKKVVVGKDITVVGDRMFTHCYNLAEIEFEEGSKIAKLGNEAFHYAMYLKSVTLPDSLKVLDYAAFGYCDKLVYVQMPEFATSINTNAFWNHNANLKLNVVEGSYAETYAKNNNILTETRKPKYGPTDIIPGDAISASGTCGENAMWTLYESGKMIISGSGAVESYSNFKNTPWYSIKDKIQAIKIGKDITSIGTNAFSHLYNLEYIVFEEGSQLNTLESHAFHYALKVKTVVLPSTVKSIGYSALGYMSNLSYVWIPDGVTSINANAFLNMTPSNITLAVAEGVYANTYATQYGFKVELREKVPVLVQSGTCGDGLTWALYDNGILYINGEGTMPDYHYAKYNVNVAPWALYRAEITKVVIGAGVENIGTYAFYQCTALAEVEFAADAKLSAINEGAFGYTDALKSITLPASLKTIGKCGFYFSGLETVAFAEDSRMISFGDYVFRNCTALTSVFIPDGVTSIGEYIFHACGGQVIMDVAEGSAAHKYATKCNYAVTTREPRPAVKYSGTCGEGLTWDLYNNGVLYINGEGAMPDYHYAKYNVNAAPWALYRAEITKVVIGAGVENIGTYAFYQCTALAEVEFAANAKLSAINEGAFGYTDALKSITLPASLKTIGKCGFYFSGLETVAFAEGSVMATFGDYVFRNCTALTEVYMPDSVSGIGVAIFHACGNQVVMNVAAGSYAEKFAQSKGMQYTTR